MLRGLMVKKCNHKIRYSNIFSTNSSNCGISLNQLDKSVGHMIIGHLIIGGLVCLVSVLGTSCKHGSPDIMRTCSM